VTAAFPPEPGPGGRADDPRDRTDPAHRVEDPVADPQGVLAERIAAAVTAHPTVARLHGGPFNEIGTHLTGRRLIGVRVGTRVEVGVVLRLERPVRAVVEELRGQVAGLVGGRPVDITVGDVE
jgi:hypothetical protein